MNKRHHMAVSRRPSLFFALLFTLFSSSILIFPHDTAHAATTTTKYLNGRIVFYSTRDGNSEIYTMEADGSGQTRLTNNPGQDYAPSWSPDGSKIVFVSDRDGAHTQIYTMNLDGSGQTRLTNNVLDEDNPSWSPDGTKIVFARYSSGFSDANIYTMNADGSGQLNLTNTANYNETASWSPDGNKIVFSTDRDGNLEIYAMDTNGSNLTNLTNTPSRSEYDPDWSPNGTKIAYINNIAGADIYTMNANGSSQTRITNTSPSNNYRPQWSPDNSKILFTKAASDFSTFKSYVMNSDGSGAALFDTGAGTSNAQPSQQPLPYTVTTNDNGTVTSTISASSNYSTTDYTVVSGETLVLDGTLCDVTVQSGGTLMGTGHACTITVNSGGTLAPGHSPGCITSGNLSLSGTYIAQLAGTTPCSGYDQMQVTGTVTLTNSSLTPSLLNGFTPTSGNTFILIDNDSNDPVTGTFTGIPEGTTITIGNSVFKISYVGGTGNDVTLTAQGVPGAPNTGLSMTKTNGMPVVLASVLSIVALLLLTKHLKKTGNR